MKINEAFFKKLGYPKAWIEDSSRYSPQDSYIIFDPDWEDPVGEIPRISIYELFRRTAQKFPNETALVYLDRKFTYAELDEMINRFASVLLDIGVSKGDFIAIMLPNSPQHWVSFYAIAQVGAIHAPLNVMYKEEEIKYQVADCGAKTVITLDLFYGHFAKLKNELGLENIIVTNLKEYAEAGFEAYEALKPFWAKDPDPINGTIDFRKALEKSSPTEEQTEIDAAEDVAQIIYTAGTTGRSKGAMQTHLNLVHNSVTHSLMVKVKGKPVNYTVLPMFHTGGFFLFPLPVFYMGGTVITAPIFDPGHALQTIQKEKVNALFGSPTLFLGLLQYPEFKNFDISSLDISVSGAAPVPAELVSAWEETARVKMAVGWGMTEMNTAGTFSLLKNRKNPDSVGSPLIGEVKIVDANGATAPRGQEGELLYRGLQVSKGYFNKVEENAKTFQEDGWLHTGDAGWMDEDGFVHFTDRIKDLVIASGYNIAPVEVEYTLIKHPSVLEAAVVGVPDEYRGETIKAFVVLKDEFKGKVTEHEIMSFCQGKLATFKVPKMLEFIDELPKNAIGKTLRRVLRQR